MAAGADRMFGVKYKRGDQTGDIDLLACCDGYLVFCECKNLAETPTAPNPCLVGMADCPRNRVSDFRIWEDVIDQFLETVKVAKHCRANLVVLASRASEYPQSVIDRLTKEISTSIPYLLLKKEDLESGYREVKDNTVKDHPISRNLRFYDILPYSFPEALRIRTGNARTINTTAQS